MAATAQLLHASLGVYEADLDVLVQQRWDAELYARLSEQFEEMRSCAALLPDLSVCWVELLITRLELSHALWSSKPAGRINGRVLGLHAQHKTCIAEARRRCLGYLPGEAAAVSYNARGRA